ncbi:MAG: class I SAM-dependent rRNA methyltransferase [candidate division WOR-3 bacterium]|nr:class I SAM-dependent rRNA methyltransferase [candidate division WOR-3 bacterium]MDW7988126.1 class I SAM-dependent rRNA methyltransferase [candidate division WOR-3 bacterium]
MKKYVINVERKKHRRQHPWIYSNEILTISGTPNPGDVVIVYEHGKLIGSGIYNPNSLITIRLYSPVEEDLNVDFFKRKFQEALKLRKTVLPNEEDFRLIYGESDGVPGLVIDKYQNHFALQTYSLGVDKRKMIIVEALKELFEVKSVVEKNDFRLRDAEGLPRQESVLYGNPEPVIISENKVKYKVDIFSGQKTGFYFDQRITRAKVQRLSKGLEVLDVFCYSGGFALNAALGGAKSVLGIDASKLALELAEENARLNNVEKVCKFICADAFDKLRELYRKRLKFDLIILDPPPFFKSLKEKSRGLRGYKDINLQAMKLLKSGGILVSCTCSHYLFWQDLLDVLNAAAQDLGRNFRIIDRSTQGPDHPVLLHLPESEYLRCFFLEMTND